MGKMLVSVLFLILPIIPHAAPALFSRTTESEENTQMLSELKQEIFKSYNGGFRSVDIFVSRIWPKLADVFPKSVNVPGLQYTNPNSKISMCQTEFIFKSKLGKRVIYEREVLDDKTVSVKIYGKLNIDKKVEFSLFPKQPNKDDKLTVKASYKFDDGENTIKLSLIVPKSGTLLDLNDYKCLVKIENIKVWSLSDPIKKTRSLMVPQGHEYQMYNHWQAVGEESKMMADNISFALIKAMTEDLQGNNSWICLTDDLKKKAESKQIYDYKKDCKEEK